MPRRNERAAGNAMWGSPTQRDPSLYTSRPAHSGARLQPSYPRKHWMLATLVVVGMVGVALPASMAASAKSHAGFTSTTSSGKGSVNGHGQRRAKPSPSPSPSTSPSPSASASPKPSPSPSPSPTPSPSPSPTSSGGADWGLAVNNSAQDPATLETDMGRPFASRGEYYPLSGGRYPDQGVSDARAEGATVYLNINSYH